MGRSQQFRAVIYDLDGTLLDTLADIAGAMNAVLAERRFPLHSTDDYRGMVGWGLRELVRKALPEGHDDTDVDRCFRGMKQYYASHPVVYTRPYPGIATLLGDVARRGYRQAILSNKSDELVREIVMRTLPDVPFSAVQGAVPSVPHKPDPASALNVCSRIGVRPEECVYVGDSSVDVATARAAGMFPVGVSWGFRGPEELASAGLSDIITAPAELLTYLPALAGQAAGGRSK